jgi:hypothetical protein
MPGSGTVQDPWQLRTPPGTSEYTMYRDESADPPALVCQVGSTTLKYYVRAIDDLDEKSGFYWDGVTRINDAPQRRRGAGYRRVPGRHYPGHPCSRQRRSRRHYHALRTQPARQRLRTRRRGRSGHHSLRVHRLLDHHRPPRRRSPRLPVESHPGTANGGTGFMSSIVSALASILATASETFAPAFAPV